MHLSLHDVHFGISEHRHPFPSYGNVKPILYAPITDPDSYLRQVCLLRHVLGKSVTEEASRIPSTTHYNVGRAIENHDLKTVSAIKPC